MSDDDSVVPFPKRKREPGEKDDTVLHVIHQHSSDCNHISTIVSTGGLNGRLMHAQYRLRAGETEVECSLCHCRLDPMWVLLQLAAREGRMVQRVADKRAELIALNARLDEQSKAKCEHCGRFTRLHKRRRR